jgi:hypothetical protein
MKAWAGTAALMAAVAAASPAAARQPIEPFCVELRRVVAAAGEDPSFASLPRIDGARARPMFGFRAPCGVGDRPPIAFVCQEQLAPPEVTAERLIAASARCLRGAVRLPDRERDGWGGGTLLRLRYGGVVITAAEWAHRTRGGRQSSFAVERPAEEQ